VERKKFEIAGDEEVKKRRREIQLLMNIQEPDPEYQPFLFTDEAFVFDVNGDSEEEIREKYSFYFKENFSLSFNMPLWKLVDEIKIKYPGWPDND
jgi:DNA polymerase IIIc chi subunit